MTARTRLQKERRLASVIMPELINFHTLATATREEDMAGKQRPFSTVINQSAAFPGVLPKQTPLHEEG